GPQPARRAHGDGDAAGRGCTTDTGGGHRLHRLSVARAQRVGHRADRFRKAKSMSTRESLILCSCAWACAPIGDDAPCPADAPAQALVAAPVLDAPCELDAAAPTRLLVTTTDFSTGAVSIVDLASATVTSDVASATTDSIPAWHDGLGVLVNRY